MFLFRTSISLRMKMLRGDYILILNTMKKSQIIKFDIIKALKDRRFSKLYFSNKLIRIRDSPRSLNDRKKNTFYTRNAYFIEKAHKQCSKKENI